MAVGNVSVLVLHEENFTIPLFILVLYKNNYILVLKVDTFREFFNIVINMLSLFMYG